MKKHTFYFALLCLVYFTVSCEEESLNTYSGRNSIYYTWSVEGYKPQVNITYPDSLGFSFAFEPESVTQSVFNLQVSVQGMVVDYDREISVKVNPNSTAVSGIHFSLPDKIIFGANKATDSVPVTFYRTQDMQDSTFSLILDLAESADFVVDMKDKVLDELTGKTLSFTSFEITVNDILVTPRYWYRSYFGNFSIKKLKLMSELLDIPLDYYEENNDSATRKFHGLFMQRWLNEKEKNGETVYEADGVTKMVMGRRSQG